MSKELNLTFEFSKENVNVLFENWEFLEYLIGFLISNTYKNKTNIVNINSLKYLIVMIKINSINQKYDKIPSIIAITFM